MLDRILQTIGHNLKVDYQNLSFINGFFYGNARLFKIGQLAIIKVFSARKNSTVSDWETIAKVPVEFLPAENISYNAYYIPSDGILHSCELRITLTGNLDVTGVRQVPQYGINGTLVYKAKLGGVINPTIILLPREVVILC